MPAPGQSDAVAQVALETERLFEECSAGLTRYLRTAQRDADECEDIAQETFVRFFRARCNGEEIANPKAWLYTVGRRLALDYAKKAKPVLLNEEGWRTVESRHAEPPFTAADERSERWSSLPWHALSPAERECLLLRAEGLTFREVADVLDVTVSTAASYVARAVKKFRKSVLEPSETPKHRRAAPLR